MDEKIIEYRGFGLGHVFIAALAGAALGATLGPGARRRIGRVLDDAKDSMGRVPSALRQARVAAREAFHEALGEEAPVV
jgi:hypothetical protein